MNYLKMLKATLTNSIYEQATEILDYNFPNSIVIWNVKKNFPISIKFCY